jgi:hypothetical protein
MRKLIIVLAAVLLISVSANAQRGNYSQAIKANPLGLALGIFNAEYEFRLGTNNSLGISGNYWTLFSDWNAYGVGATYKWYFDAFNTGANALAGLGVGPALSADFWTYNTGAGLFNYDGGTTFRVGAEATYKWIFGGFVVEPGMNFMFVVSEVTGLGTISPFGIIFNIGYAW